MRIRRVAVPFVLAGVAFALAGSAAGCATEPEPAQAEAKMRPAPVRTTWPASVAGGACQLLDYAAIEKALGVRFDVAAARHQGKTETCVVQAETQSLPDLVAGGHRDHRRRPDLPRRGGAGRFGSRSKASAPRPTR